MYFTLKRFIDFSAAALLLAVFSPLFIFIAVAIKVGSSGPVFYCGERVGKDLKLFRLIKFRSMVTHADKIGGDSTADDDPRLTSIGKFIRKYKLDELPNLINVLVGQMSLVGPRAEVMRAVSKYTDEEKRVFLVRPGITDWASIKFHNEGEILRGHQDADRAYEILIRPEKLRLQLKYIEERSIVTDLKILWDTFSTLVSTRLKSKADHA